MLRMMNIGCASAYRKQVLNKLLMLGIQKASFRLLSLNRSFRLLSLNRSYLLLLACTMFQYIGGVNASSICSICASWPSPTTEMMSKRTSFITL